MGFIGKLLGAIIGFRFGFFTGLIGLFLGHLADKKLSELGTVKSSFFGEAITKQALFMQTTFAVLGHLSKSKGRVTEEDIQLANMLMDRLQLTAEDRRLARAAFQQGKAADFPLRQAIREFRLGCRQRVDLLRVFLDIQIQAAILDNELHPKEKEILFIVAQELGISSHQFEQMVAMIYASQQFNQGFYQQGGYQDQDDDRYHHSHQQSYRSNQPTLKDAYAVLGVSESDDRNAVKRAYRRLMNANHPDKLVAKGLPKEMLEMAKEKTQQIQAAYDLICKAKGWK
ncbi:molecular chaperone DjlA [Mergibacter septicus]|uniref:co-chaperone DjlA n=1 Tax=Mergibacter septicus TaxID=221402 RepID=UPI001C76404C|nr:co-chaperone DjlA [Mergibacter septicus]QDJ12606.1 molecular chaperone DjlA [Mergibacter septicus]